MRVLLAITVLFMFGCVHDSTSYSKDADGSISIKTAHWSLLRSGEYTHEVLPSGRSTLNGKDNQVSDNLSGNVEDVTDTIQLVHPMATWPN